MDEQRIRDIVRSEMQNQRYGLNQTTYHTHKGGIGGPRINSADLIPGRKTTGRVTMSHDKDYQFNTNFTPSGVRVFGSAVDNADAPTKRAIVIGEAAFGQNLYFQPDTTSSVKVGGKLEIVQSAVYFGVWGSGSSSAPHVLAQDQYLIIVDDKAGILITATVVGYGQNFFTVRTSGLDSSGWSIIANFFVS